MIMLLFCLTFVEVSLVFELKYETSISIYTNIFFISIILTIFHRYIESQVEDCAADIWCNAISVSRLPGVMCTQYENVTKHLLALIQLITNF